MFRLFLFFFLFCTPLFADDNGQIININQNYQIAFTDLGNRILSPGDIVKVTLGPDEFVYLQVIESSAILSKLGVSKTQGFSTNLNDFQRLAVGDVVIKAPAAGSAQPDNSTVIATKSPADTSSPLQVEKLEEDLLKAKEEIKLLQASNEKSKATLNQLMAEAQAKAQEPVPAVVAVDHPSDHSKEILEQLKVHLDNMHKIISENN